MNDIDLIPAEYRIRIAQRRSLQMAGVSVACAVIVALLAGSLIGVSAERARAKVAELEIRNAMTQQHRDQLEALQREQSEYERQWSLLRGLRAGADAEDMFAIIDKALSGTDLWFNSWQFRRAGVIVDAGERGVETGYFIVIKADEPGEDASQWQVETHMAIQGQARDHQALSTFVRALFEQREIKDVSVQKTSLTDYASGRAVDFDMTLVLNSALRES